MSKKDYIAIADAFRSIRVPGAVIDALIRVFKADNPAFNENRWLNYLSGKCGPSGGKIRKTGGCPRMGDPCEPE